MKKIFIMTVMLTAACCLFAQEDETCRKFYNNGMTEFNQGDYTKAKKIFSQGLKMSCSDYDFQKRIEDCDAKIKEEADRKVREAEENARKIEEEANRKVREAEAEAARKTREAEENARKVEEEANRKLREVEAEADRRIKAEADRKAAETKEEAERSVLEEKKWAEAERKAREDAERSVREANAEAERRARAAQAEADRKIREAEAEAERRVRELERIAQQKNKPRQRRVLFGATLGTSSLADSEYEVTDGGQFDISFGYLFSRHAGFQLSLAAAAYNLENAGIGFGGLYAGPLLNLPFNRSGSAGFEIYPAIGFVKELTGSEEDSQVSGDYSFSGRLGGGFRFHAGAIYFRLGANYIYSKPGKLDLSSYSLYAGIGLGF
jgi:hypothetical protein